MVLHVADLLNFGHEVNALSVVEVVGLVVLDLLLLVVGLLLVGVGFQHSRFSHR